MAGIVMIAKRVVAEDLAARFAGIAVENILIYQGESLWSDPPRRKLMAKSYKGPELAELHFPLNIESDPALSTLVEVDRCDACGILSYDVKGVEKILGENEPRELFKGDLNYNRSPWMGLRVRAADLNGAMAYRYGGGRAQVLEPVKNYIEERGWTNVEFVDYGAIT